jgi:diguanylate cyclase (GGDEF)-like protein
MAFWRCVRQSLVLGGGLLLALLGAARVHAQSLSTFEASASSLTPGHVVQGHYDTRFHPASSVQARLSGDPSLELWLRIAFDLPAAGDPHESRQALRFDRVPLDAIRVFMPQPEGGYLELSDGFFAPSRAQELAANSYAFAIPHHLRGAQVVYVAARSRAAATLAPQVVTERALHAQDRDIASLLSAVYASIGVLALSALALFLALRDRAYLQFCALTGGLLLLLLAMNGHLYRWTPFGWWAWWHYHGIYALAALCCALSLAFTRQFLETAQRDAAVDRAMQWLGRALLALAGLCLLNLDALTATLQRTAVLAGVLTTTIIVLVSVRAWRRGELLARPYCLIWLILVGAASVRAALTQGWLPPTPAGLYGFQLASAFSLFLMSIGLADRVMEFRKQRDRARLLRDQIDASLQLEQVRRQFSDGLREQLRQSSPGGDLEWVALRRVLISLRSLLPQRGAAVIASGYRGQDLLLVEPMESKDRYAALAAHRSAELRALCRTGKSAIVTLETASGSNGSSSDHSSAGVFALLPLSVDGPGWGALLIERAAGADFTPEEVGMAADFLKQALALADEATHQAELKHKAEIDPLTGAYNRRAGDTLLAQAWQHSLAERKPFALLFVDLDHFKRVNDHYGHAVGDDCLRRAADTIRHEIRADDVLARYGGEEFLVVLPGLTPELAMQLGERVRQAVLALRVQNGEAQVRFSVSIGVAARLPGETDAQDVVERADRALYVAKRNGRNQVQMSTHFGYGENGTDAEPPPPLSL